MEADPGDRSGVAAEGVTHRYGGRAVLEDLSLTVEQGSFCTLLGPSGSGKTTLLRIFAGLLDPAAGRITIGGRDVTRVPVQRRSIGFVFQHYALFPHLTVAGNIAYPLKVRGSARAERKRLVDEMIGFADLDGLADRLPGELSGGQQQRVAIARALVFRPDVLLLDEPLGALDRRLRQQLGAELRRIQRETGTTAVYVTHDQEEALVLSDTVAVMDGGAIRQVGTPVELYRRPADRFVASFLGDTNLLRCDVVDVEAGGVRLAHGGATFHGQGGAGLRPGDACSVSVRPEELRVVRPDANGAGEDGEHEALGRAHVRDVAFLGACVRLTVALEAASGEPTEVTAEIGAGSWVPDVGDLVVVGWRRGAPVAVAEVDGPPGRSAAA